jgi:hypothetical protein
MDIKEKVQQRSLVEWAFMWNQARLIIAGITLVIAQQVPVLVYLPVLGRLASSFMVLAWLISGVAAVYLIYNWYTSGKTVFGGNDTKDVIAFWVATISGVHLGLAAIYTNIGFAVTPDFLIVPAMILAGLAYFWSAYRLHSRGGVKALFANNTNPSTEPVNLETPPTQPPVTP